MNQEMKIFLNVHPIIRMRSGKCIWLNSVKRLIRIKSYSRRINIQHRIVYEVYVQETYKDDVEYEGIVKVAHMWTRCDGMR